MKRTFVVIILFYLVVQISEAQMWKQKRIETLAGIGTSQFFGDIGGFSKTENILGLKDIRLSQTRFNLELGVKYKILNELNIRLNLAYGMLHATDSHGSNELRGLEAKTSVFEPSVLAEYYFIKSELGNSYLFTSGKSTAGNGFFSALEFYTFAGIGGVSFNVNRNDKLVAMNQQSSGFTPVIPIGIGVNLLFKPEFNLGVELGGRYAFSDYLDGYHSQHSTSNDVYYFLNVTFTYKIQTNENGLPSFLGKRRF